MDVNKIRINMPVGQRPNNSIAFWHNKIIRAWLEGGGRIPESRVYPVFPEGKIEIIRIDNKPVFLYGAGKGRREVFIKFSEAGGDRIVSVFEKDGRLAREYAMEKDDAGNWKAVPLEPSERQALNLHGENIRRWFEEGGPPPADKPALVYKKSGQVKLCNIDKRAVFLSGFERLKGQKVILRFRLEGRSKVIAAYEENGELFRKFTLRKEGDTWRAVSEEPNINEYLNNNLIRPAIAQFAAKHALLSGADNLVFQRIAAEPIYLEIDGRRKVFDLRRLLAARGLPNNLYGAEQLIKRLGLH